MYKIVMTIGYFQLEISESFKNSKNRKNKIYNTQKWQFWLTFKKLRKFNS